MDGCVSPGMKIVAAHSQETYQVNDIGVMYPEPVSTEALYAGQVGFLVSGMRNVKV
jgi:translation elongation factor EF-4